MKLPVESLLPGLSTALEVHGSAVVIAPPGTGKTTLVPIHLMRADSKLLMLEPRRIAARAAANRMAALIGETVGHRVGYVTRDERRTSSETLVEVVTEGILTRRLQRDPSLEGIGTLIFDEFHERNLQSDLGMGLALDVRDSIRPDLRIVVMSATIDADKVSTLLGGAPVLRAEGRLHPVETVWAPRSRSARAETHTAAVIRRAIQNNTGDVLVFLPGMAEIRRTERELATIPAEVHRLHGSLSPEEQDRALWPSTQQKVILSTDIAESSLTVEGVTSVVDSGETRTPKFDSRTQMTRLTTVAISRASADQRSGRAGRTGPGIAYRLWSKMEHGTRPLQTAPEIAQVELAGFALELAAWGVTDPKALRFLDQPPARTLAEAVKLLRRLGALDQDLHITERGRRMAATPLHPRLAAMVDGADHHRRLACFLSAIVEDRDPLRGPPSELPIDIALRVAVLTGIGRHPAADSRSVRGVLRTAEDLIRRLGISDEPIDPAFSGELLAMAYPDRLAIRRGSPGRFQIKSGPTAFCDAADSLAPEQFLIAVDLDGKRKDSRIRLAAAIEASAVVSLFGDEVTSSTELRWDGDRTTLVTEDRLGGLVLRTSSGKPAASPALTDFIIARVRREGVEGLPWSDSAINLRDRVRFLGQKLTGWPDLGGPWLSDHLETWLAPHLSQVTSMTDIDSRLLDRALRKLVGSRIVEVDRLAPIEIGLASGRRAPVDYSGPQPVIAVKVQALFGTKSTPLVGGEPVQVQLLSPAGRPVQITSDLEGFWTGTWHQVRKDMLGRYPKHSWPERPH